MQLFLEDILQHLVVNLLDIVVDIVLAQTVKMDGKYHIYQEFDFDEIRLLLNLIDLDRKKMSDMRRRLIEIALDLSNLVEESLVDDAEDLRGDGSLDRLAIV